MENNVVKAFRQRLVRGGYTNISIYNRYNGKYRVKCISPENEVILVELTEIQMNAIPRLIYFEPYLPH